MLLELSLTSSGQLCLSLVKWNCFWQSTGELRLISIYCPFRHIIFLERYVQCPLNSTLSVLGVCAWGVCRPAVGGGLSSSSGACGWDGVLQIYQCQPMLTCWVGLGWLVMARAVLRLQLAADMLCGLVVLSTEASDVL